jgi:hypothetical protein
MSEAKGKRQTVKGKSKKTELIDISRAFGFKYPLLIALCLGVSVVNYSQTGGALRIENSTVAAGSGKNSGGSYALESTAGQGSAGGRLQGGRFSVQSGFWTADFAPTAAAVSIGGRVVTAGGQGIRNARVTLTRQNGETRISQTGSFGFYRFDDIPVGEICVLTVSGKRFIFENPTRIVTVQEELGDLDFTAVEQ